MRHATCARRLLVQHESRFQNKKAPAQIDKRTACEMSPTKVGSVRKEYLIALQDKYLSIDIQYQQH